MINVGHVTPTIVTAKLCALSSADFLVDVNMKLLLSVFLCI